MARRFLIAPALGAALAAVLVLILGAPGVEAIPSAPPAAPAVLRPVVSSAMTLNARPVVTDDAVVTLTEITGLRSATVGSFGQESDPHADGRLFVDTTDGGAILGTPDQQRVKLAVRVTPNDADISNLEIRWELRDPDDPATLAEIDADGSGGDNTGTPHENATHWFIQADHAITGQIDRTPVDEDTVVGEARTAITMVGGQLVSTVYLRYGDDGGDNYRVRAVLRQKSPGVDCDEDDSGLLTVWRRREVSVYAMTKPNDDVQVFAPGTSPGAFRVCITAGPNGQCDTMFVGGDDAHRGEVVHAGPNGVVETTANSGGTSFDPQATVGLYRDAYANAGANNRSYIDWIVSNEQFDRPYHANMTREEVRDYMHDDTDFVHDGALMSLLGVNAILDIFGNASYPPHCGVAVGTILTNTPAQMPKTDMHEIGHLLIGSFEGAGDFHSVHSVGQICGYRQGLHDPVICSRHANMLRDRVARDFGAGHSHGGVTVDSAETR